MSTIEFNVKINLPGHKLGVFTVGDDLINQIVENLNAGEYIVEGQKYKVSVISTRHYANGVVMANCRASVED